MAKNRDPFSQLKEVNFSCSDCRHKFAGEPDRVLDAPGRGHPYQYFAICPICDAEAAQANWEQGLMASYGKHTGPKTPEGKSAAAENIAGHPTAEETIRTRFNAMKHGLKARVAKYFPAKPGSYPHCNTCDIDWGDCAASVACMRRTELFMRHQIAFETQDPGLLTDIRSDLQASIQAIIDDIILAITSEGVALRNPAYSFDKDGGFHIAEYEDTDGNRRLIEEVRAHPLLKVLSEFISRNGMSLTDMGMTVKTAEAEPHNMGNISGGDENKASLLEYQKQQTRQLEALADMIKNSQRRINEDPVVIEYGNNG